MTSSMTVDRPASRSIIALPILDDPHAKPNGLQDLSYTDQFIMQHKFRILRERESPKTKMKRRESLYPTLLKEKNVKVRSLERQKEKN